MIVWVICPTPPSVIPPKKYIETIFPKIEEIKDTTIAAKNIVLKLMIFVWSIIPVVIPIKTFTIAKRKFSSDIKIPVIRFVIRPTSAPMCGPKIIALNIVPMLSRYSGKRYMPSIYVPKTFKPILNSKISENKIPYLKRSPRV